MPVGGGPPAGRNDARVEIQESGFGFGVRAGRPVPAKRSAARLGPRLGGHASLSVGQNDRRGRGLAAGGQSKEKILAGPSDGETRPTRGAHGPT